MRYAVMLIGAFVAAFLTLILLIVVDKATGKRRSKKYIAILEENYPVSGVLGSLEIASTQFRKRCNEAIAIRRAVDYLKESILRDYETAFEFVEKGFPQKAVHAAHEKIMRAEMDKQNTRIRLPEKAGSQT